MQTPDFGDVLVFAHAQHDGCIASCCCCDDLSQAWLQRARTGDLTTLEVRSPKCILLPNSRVVPRCSPLSLTHTVSSSFKASHGLPSLTASPSWMPPVAGVCQIIRDNLPLSRLFRLSCTFPSAMESYRFTIF